VLEASTQGQALILMKENSTDEWRFHQEITIESGEFGMNSAEMMFPLLRIQSSGSPHCDMFLLTFQGYLSLFWFHLSSELLCEEKKQKIPRDE